MAYNKEYIGCMGNAGGQFGAKRFVLHAVDAGTAAGYISNAAAPADDPLHMQIGDVVEVVQVDSVTAPTSVTGVTVRAVTAISAAGAATIA